MIQFCWPLWVAGFAGLYIGSANRYYIRIFSSIDEVGLYELAVKFSSIITLLIWQPFSQYWQTERFSYYRQENPIPVYQRVFQLISTLMVLAALGIAIFSGPIIYFMADTAFQRAETAVPFLAFGAVFGCLTTFSNFSFLVKGKTGWMSQNEYITAAIVTILYFLLIPLFGFTGAALALMLAQGAQFLIVHIRAKAHYDMQLSLLPLGTNLVIACVGCAAAHYFHSGDLLWDITIKILIFTLCAIAIIGGLLREPMIRESIKKLLSPYLPDAINRLSKKCG